MSKLNATTNQIELNTNKVTSTTPSSGWTDTQYPSAKALYSAYTGLNESITKVETRCTNLETSNSNNKMLNIAHPVGSVLITSTNTNPANTIGGTWQLIDKGFISSNTTNVNYFTAGANVVEDSIWITRACQTMRIRLNVTINTEITDTTGITVGTFNYNNMGITRLPANIVGSVTYSDGANCGISWYLNESTGVLNITDVFDLSTLTSGNSFCFDISFPLVYSQMLDSVCDKFYWKRTA